MTPRPVIAVVGPGHPAADELCELAREVGRLLARRGAAVITGGLGGVMAAAALGVRDNDGLVIGVLPGDDSTAADEHLDVALATGLGQARNVMVVSAADAVIAVGGSWGTLSEIALAHRIGKPVVCLRGWQVSDHEGKPIRLEIGTSAKHAVELLAETLRWQPDNDN